MLRSQVTKNSRCPRQATKLGRTALTPPPPVVPRSSAYIWLALPHNVTAGPNEAVVRAPPHRETWHQVRHRYKQRWLGYPEEDELEEPDYAKRETPGMRVQVHPECLQGPSPRYLSPELTCFYKHCKLIEEAEHFIYIENQFFISSTYDNDEVKNQIAGALVERIIRAAQAGEKIQVIVTIPGFSGNIMDEGSLKIIMAAQYRTINRGGHSIYAEIRKAGFEPLDFIRFYHLRSYDHINAPLCVKHHEAQIALARQWIGNDSDGSQKEVTISLPVETKEGILHTDKTPLKTETVPIPESEDAARRVIEKFEAVAKAVRGDEDVADNVAQHMLHDRTSMLEEKWRGSEQEELDAYMSELLYIHTKLMIVDDKRVIMGSANINDRSQKIALVVEDGDMIRSTMNGKPYEVARFATTSSSAHLGLIPPQTSHKRTEEATSFMRPAPTLNEDEAGCEEDGLVADPLPEQTIFRPVPTNLVRDWEAYDGYVPKVKAGHVVPGIPLERVKKQLSEVMGALVECPLDFLIDQKEFVEGPEWKGLNPTLPVRIYNAKESAQVLWLFKVYRKQDESSVHCMYYDVNHELSSVSRRRDVFLDVAIMSFRVKASERKTTPKLLRDLGADLPKRDRVEPARCEGSVEL
ncbi:hypothetical protein B0H14DRAFT_3439215 [Mycena olivaceomarginata]|nr:hypothetical protein B0H14DRAFT_3439215 [Mycena olivaceomarginata]